MKTAVFYAPYDIRIDEVPDPVILNPHEAIVRVTYAAICGSDLWFYRGLTPRDKGARMGHEFMGVVEEVGPEVSQVKVGDTVVAPFDFADGTCPECSAGMSSACRHGGVWASGEWDGGQGERVRVPFADASLFTLPSEKVAKNPLPFLALADVLCTGYHCAVSADVAEGKTVAVIGDGAVGLCAILGARRLNAHRIIQLSSHTERARIGQQFGSTETVDTRGDAAVKEIKRMTDDLGVDAVLECVGMPESWQTARSIVRAGGKIGFVGIPHDVPAIQLSEMYSKNYGIQGGRAPVPTYIPQLIPDVINGTLDSSLIFDTTISLDEIKDGYEKMDKRKAIKVAIKL